MKKTIAIVALVCLCMVGFASGFHFSPVASTPLYKESISDPYSMTSVVHLTQVAPEDNDFRITGLVYEKDHPEKVFYDEFKYTDKYDNENVRNNDNLYINMKLSGQASLFRFRFDGAKFLPSLDLELNLAGYINTFFWLSGANDVLDYDGSYLLGASMRVADRVTVRAGLHHFSGHYGDETLENLYSFNQVDFKTGVIQNYTGAKAEAGKEYVLLSEVEYVRDNSYLLGISADVTKGLRIYGECELPKSDAWIRPFVTAPTDKEFPDMDRIAWGEFGYSEDDLIGRDTKAEEKLLEKTREDGYYALRVHGGAEYTFNFKYVDFILSADVQAHQDGQVRNEEGKLDFGAYKSTNPWEMEYTAGGALVLKDTVFGDKTLRLQAFYHVGRTPGTQWFYKNGSFVYVGFGLN